MYIAFWQLHSPLYLEKSRVIWDSAYCCGRGLLVLLYSIVDYDVAVLWAYVSRSCCFMGTDEVLQGNLRVYINCGEV